MDKLTLTREQVLAMAEYAKRDIHEGKHFSVHPDAQLALCDLALQALSMTPRPIEEAPKDGQWILAFFGKHWCVVRWENGQIIGYWEDRTGAAPEVSFGRPTHFIPLTSLPTPGET